MFLMMMAWWLQCASVVMQIFSFIIGTLDQYGHMTFSTWKQEANNCSVPLSWQPRCSAVRSDHLLCDKHPSKKYEKGFSGVLLRFKLPSGWRVDPDQRWPSFSLPFARPQPLTQPASPLTQSPPAAQQKPHCELCHFLSPFLFFFSQNQLQDYVTTWHSSSSSDGPSNWLKVIVCAYVWTRAQ